jgi:hypothetical protein
MEICLALTIANLRLSLLMMGTTARLPGHVSCEMNQTERLRIYGKQ